MDGRGTFITFEGGEGAGKTTQIALLVEALRQAGRDVVVTREPGGCAEAEALRELLLHKKELHFDPINQALLMTAARRAHVASVINPALTRGQIVLCDRFFDSTLAYQGYGLGVPLDKLNALHSLAIDGLQPDLTLLLDVDVDKGLARARGRGEADKMESLNKEFHERLRQGYLDMAAQNPKRITIVDASRAPEKVQMDIRVALEAQLGIAL